MIVERWCEWMKMNEDEFEGRTISTYSLELPIIEARLLLDTWIILTRYRWYYALGIFMALIVPKAGTSVESQAHITLTRRRRFRSLGDFMAPITKILVTDNERMSECVNPNFFVASKGNTMHWWASTAAPEEPPLSPLGRTFKSQYDLTSSQTDCSLLKTHVPVLLSSEHRSV
jgi:hypothetical protein